MRTAINKAATSLVLIVFVAVGTRVAFAWSQARRIPGDVLAAASFDQETGSIAKSVASGKGYSSPYNRDTGPTAWLAPVYPLIVAGTFKVLGVDHSVVLFFGWAEHRVFGGNMHTALFCR
jgi:hypothetical protein